MRWNGSLREVIKTCDYKGILEILKTVPEEEWNKDTAVRNSKEKVGNTNLDTRALLLKYKSTAATGPGFVDYEKNDVETLNKLKPFLDVIISDAKNFYGYENLKLTNIVFTELRRGGIIPEHSDTGKMLTTHHRIHIPLVSDPAVKFTLDHKDYYLEPGHGYEINNQLTHEVRNESNIDRIHMIIDLKEWDNDYPELYEVDSKKY
jgi:hypothetical protein